MKLPDKLNRRAVVSNLDKVNPKTWEYLFDCEKVNGLAACRTKGCGIKHVWYATELLMIWLVERGYYLPEDFEEKKKVRPSRWADLNIKRHVIAA